MDNYKDLFLSLCEHIHDCVEKQRYVFDKFGGTPSDVIYNITTIDLILERHKKEEAEWLRKNNDR